MADFASKNALILKELNKQGTLTFVNPEECEEVYLLAISANGMGKVAAQVYYEDGTNENASLLTVFDWYGENATGNEAVFGLSRIMTKSTYQYDIDEIDGRNNFRLYEFTLKTNKSKKVKNILFQKWYGGSGYVTILGVARKGFQDVTGIENIENRPSASAVNGIYTINGMKINTLQKGINIIKMSDGTTRKVVIK